MRGNRKEEKKWKPRCEERRNGNASRHDTAFRLLMSQCVRLGGCIKESNFIWIFFGGRRNFPFSWVHIFASPSSAPTHNRRKDINILFFSLALRAFVSVGSKREMNGHGYEFPYRFRF